MRRPWEPRAVLSLTGDAPEMLPRASQTVQEVLGATVIVLAQAQGRHHGS